MPVVFLLIAALFVLLGILFALGKGENLIAGYNTLSAKEKEKYDKKKLCRTMSAMMFLLAAGWLAAAAGGVFHVKALYWIGMTLFLLVVLGGVIYLNTGNRCRK